MRFTKLKYFRVPLMVLACVAVFSSCKKSSDEVPEVNGQARMKFVNAQADAQPQDAFINDVKVTTAPVAYNNSSEYVTVQAGSRTMTTKNQGSTAATASSPLNIGADISFSAYYVKDAQGGRIFAWLDDLSATPADRARVRFINLGAGFTNGVNFTEVAGGFQFITGLQFGSPSQYYNITPNSALKVSAAGSIKAIDIPGSTFVAGKIYTIWINADAAGDPLVHVLTHN